MREALALLLLVFTIVLAAALYSYSVADPSFNHATDKQPGNTLGIFGAYISDLLLQFMGYASVLVIIMLGLWAGRMAFGYKSGHEQWRLLFWIPSIVSLASLFHLHLYRPIMGLPELPAGTGGALGMMLADGLRLSLGLWGLSIILTGLLLSSLMIATRFSLPNNTQHLLKLLRISRTLFTNLLEWTHLRVQRRRERIEHRERQQLERNVEIKSALDQSQEIKLEATIPTHNAQHKGENQQDAAQQESSHTLPEKTLNSSSIDHILDQVVRHLPKAKPTKNEPLPSLNQNTLSNTIDEIPDDLLPASIHDETTKEDEQTSNTENSEPSLDLNTLEIPQEILAPAKPATSQQPKQAADSSPNKPKKKSKKSKPPSTPSNNALFLLPSLDIFHPAPVQSESYSQQDLQTMGALLEEKLRDYKVEGTVRSVKPGPVVVQFEYQPAPGTKVSRIIGLQDDLARSIAAVSVRVAGNIPGKHVIGIEIPNKNRQMVSLHEVLASDAFTVDDKLLPMALGVDIAGRPVVTDLAGMPHLLVAGTTGSGKSVSMNTMICSLLMKHTPETLRMIMVDPKMLELSMYDGIPHLLVPVVTKPKKAARALDWAVFEMERRYQLMSDAKVRNLNGYNQQANERNDMDTLPLIVIVIDELADLMMVAGKDVEQSICRLAQKARAAGIHLVLATQRPSVDVITGLIKANLPSRLAFRVSSRIDARTILDQMGAEQLLGQGDALLMTGGCNMSRVHGAFVSDAEVMELTEYLKSQGSPEYHEEVFEAQGDTNGVDNEEEERDAKYDEAAALVIEKGQCSVSMVQRYLRIGYNRASRIVDHMERDGLISAPGSGGIRQVLSRSMHEEQ